MSSMSDRITSMVKSSDMSIRQLAKHLGVSNVSLSNWMRGETEPSEEGLFTLCEFFPSRPHGFVMAMPLRQEGRPLSSTTGQS